MSIRVSSLLQPVLFASWVLSGMACEDRPAKGTRALFAISAASEDLFALPYPNDLRLQADGTIDLATLTANAPDLLELYASTVRRNRAGGFSLGGAAFFRFSGPIDTHCLPDSPAASQQASASVFWVNIQADSPAYGQRVPIRTQYLETGGHYIGPYSLAVAPVPGFVLAPATHYAVIITEALCDAVGDAVVPDADFRALLAAEAPEEAALQQAYQLYQPLREYLSGSSRSGVVAAAVFTTGRPTEVAKLARDVLYRSAAPVAQDLVVAAETERYYEIQGTYRAPNFQSGKVPYESPPDGEIERDAEGQPVIERNETLRFALTLPKGPMPVGGWPLVLYAHGTGGDYRSFITSGVAERLAEVRDGEGRVIARLAMISIDQVLHGWRAPEGAPLLRFFNLQNPVASVDNVIQGGIDYFSLLRMAQILALQDLPWSTSAGQTGTVQFAQPMRVDGRRIYFMGHSQGALTGVVFLAYEPNVRAAVLSGASGNVILSLLNKSAPLDVAAFIRATLTEPVDEFHPMLSIMQQMLDGADPCNYGALLLQQPPAGSAPKHVLLAEGIIDHYTPGVTTEALAVALGVPHAGTILSNAEGLELRGYEAVSLPVAGNLSVAGQAVTAGLLQYRAPQNTTSCEDSGDCESQEYCDLQSKRCTVDGHFVVFQHGEAMRQYARFLAGLARDGVAVLSR